MTFSGEAEFESWATRVDEFYDPASRAKKEFLLTRKLVLAARRYTSHVDELIQQRTGHSRSHWQTLSALAFSEGPVPTLELSRRMAVQWPTLIRTLNRLESEGLIRRETDPSDRRSRLVSITPMGRRVMLRVQDILDPARERVLANFSEEDLVNAERLLDNLFTALLSETEESPLDQAR